MATKTLPYAPNARDSDTASVDTTDVNKTPKKTWKGRLWDTFDLPADERKLLFKVDALLLTFASLGYFLKYVCGSHNELTAGISTKPILTTRFWLVAYGGDMS